MSIPPYRPTSHNSGTGWKIAGIGCLALFLLAALGGILLVRTVKDRVDHPSKKDLMGVAILAGKAGMDGARLSQAVKAYHQQHGKYPNTLEDLVLEGDIDGKLLHNDLDDHPSPGHVSWHYIKPAENAPGDTPILEEPYQIPIGDKSQTGKIVIQLNGQMHQPKAGAASSPS